MLCLFIKIFSHNVLPEGIQSAVCAGFAILFTVLFLIGIERGEREFLAPTYGYAGMTSGILIAMVTAALPVGIDWLRGTLVMKYTPENFNILTCLLCGCEGIFAAMMIFGYVFHIIKEDFAWFDAAVVCIILNILYTDIFIYDFIPDFMGLEFDSFGGHMTVDPVTLSDSQVICIINVVLMSVLAFMMTYRYGDVRPSAAFMFVFNVLLYMLGHLWETKMGTLPVVTGIEIYSGFSLTVTMLLTIGLMILTI
ncbi:MAG: hypothetical protein J6F31_06730 [Oscillospiraceae bacterium]|nr:hypothetical protein [Oscillospiraceae bacterium]